MSKFNIRKATQEELRWFCNKLEYNPCVDITGIVREQIGDAKGGYYISPPITAMVAYDHWTYGSCEMHVMVDTDDFGGIDLRFIREVLNYPFANGRNVIIGRTPAWNTKALEFNRRIGFRKTRCIPGGWGRAPTSGPFEGEWDLVLQELTPLDVLKWFPPHLKQYSEATWIQKARKAADEKLAKETVFIPDLPGLSAKITAAMAKLSSMKIPASSPKEISEPSLTHWNNPVPSAAESGSPVATSSPITNWPSGSRGNDS